MNLSSNVTGGLDINVTIVDAPSCVLLDGIFSYSRWQSVQTHAAHLHELHPRDTIHTLHTLHDTLSCTRRVLTDSKRIRSLSLVAPLATQWSKAPSA